MSKYSHDVDNSEFILSNPISAYFAEISKYPLLSQDEVRKYSLEMRIFDELSILTRYNSSLDLKEELNIDLIFSSCNNDNFDIIISSLLSYFRNKEEYKEYYTKLKKYKLISTKLGRALNDSELKTYFDVDCSNKLSNDEILDQVKKYLIYQNAFDRLYESNLRFVVHIAKIYKKSDIEILDLINEGNIGLRYAVMKYNPDKGSIFESYATYCIRRRISRFILHNSNPVYIPYNMNYKILDFNNKVRKLEQSYARSLLPSEISKELGMPIDLVEKYLSVNFETISLNDHINDEDGIYIIDLIPSNDNVEKTALHEVEKIELYDAISQLNEKQRKIILERYGIDLDRPKSCPEIAAETGVTKQAVSSNEHKALSKLRIKLNSNIN